MSFIYDTPAASQTAPNLSPGRPTGFAENVGSAWRAAGAANLSASPALNLAEAYDPIVDALNDGRPAGDQLVNPYRLGGRAYYDPSGRARRPAGDLEAEIWSAIADRRAGDARALPDLPVDRQAFTRSVAERARRLEAENTKMAEQATGAGTAGQLLGGMARMALDPPVVATLPFGAGGGATIGRAIILEALVGGTTEALMQPKIQAYRGDLGLPAGLLQGAENVGMAAAGTGALAGIIRSGAKGISLLRKSNRELVEEFDRAVPKPTAEQKGARDALEVAVEAEEANPLPATPAGRAEHQERLAESLAAAEDGRPSPVPDRPASPVVVAPSGEADNLGGVIFAFRPDELEVDAKLFQFKEGGDAAGVTDRLAGVKTWDPVKAGQVLVYEFADGRRFIADGHQRLGLARRLAAAQPDRKITIYGHLIREIEGVSPEEARVIAAMKNIAEGTGSAIDAAKVLRVDPGRIVELPPRSELVRQANDLVELTDEAFAMVVNELVPAHFASIVGRLVKDPALQPPILGVIARAEPENATQAEAIVRQALAAGAHKETQIGLFGAEDVTRSLYAERAKVLDKALKELRRDRAVFESLVRNAETVEAAGNRLAVDENTRRARTNAAALGTLQVLANRRGTLADALNAAAGRAAEDGKYGPAVADFVAAVRQAVERGDLEGVSAGQHERDRHADAQGGGGESPAEAVEREQLEAFSEPGGPGVEAQIEQLAADVSLVIEFKSGRILEVTDKTRHPKTGESLRLALERAQKMAQTDVIETPERLALREQIGQELYGAGAAKKEKIADLVLGPPASGKSTFADPLVASRGALLIDSDMAKARLPEYEQGVGSGAVHEESAGIVEADVLPRAILAGDNIVWPLVGKTLGGVEEKIDLLKSEGYRVYIHLVDLPIEKSVERAVARFESKGRLVDPRYVASVEDKPARNFDVLIKRSDLDGYSRWSNDVPRGDAPRLEDARGFAAPEGLRGRGGRGGADLEDPHQARGIAQDQGRQADQVAAAEAAGPPGGSAAPAETFIHMGRRLARLEDGRFVVVLDDGTMPYAPGLTRPEAIFNADIAGGRPAAPPAMEKIDTVDGLRDQAVIAGAEKVGDRQLAERRMAAPRLAGAEQRGVDGLPMFDSGVRGQAGLFDAVPIGERIDADGARVAEARSAEDLLDELADDEKFIDELDGCLGGGGRAAA